MNERYSRQHDLVPPQRIAECSATVIGVGAIGRQVALQLAAMGITRLQIIDHDHVEEANIASQGYMEKDLNHTKVDATGDLCLEINSGLELDPVAARFRRSMETGDIVFCCVDSIDTRRLIWQAVKDKVRFLADGRMSAEVLRVLTVCDTRSREHYPTTLFSSQQAYQGICTAKTTIYCANIAAGFMLTQFTKYLRQLPVEPDIQVNLLACEIDAGQC